MELLGHGVSASTCSAVVKVVIDSVPVLADVSLKDLPTRQAVDDMRLEAGVVARMHVCSEIEKHTFQGYALYTDDGTDAQVSRYIIPYPTLPHTTYILPYPTLSYPILPIISYHVLPYPSILDPILLSCDAHTMP